MLEEQLEQNVPGGVELRRKLDELEVQLQDKQQQLEELQLQLNDQV